MKIRTLTELDGFLDSELAWRRKELQTLRFDVKTASPAEKGPRLRGGVALLYAHWEGFIKQAGEAYISFVSNRDLTLDALSTNFLAMALKTKLAEFAQTNNAHAMFEFIDYFRKNLSDVARLPRNNAINTKSNVSSAVLRNIVQALGLDYQPFELKEKLLDSNLLYLRNNIAHGKGLVPTEGEFSVLFDEITELMDELRNQISAAAKAQSYSVNKLTSMPTEGSAAT